MSFDQVASQFIPYYYQVFDSDRTQLGPLYQEQSMLSYQGSRMQGVQAILTYLTENVSFKTCQHQISAFDAQPLPGNEVLVQATGYLKVDQDEHPMPFSQTFHLVPVNGGASWYILNDIFRLNMMI